MPYKYFTLEATSVKAVEKKKETLERLTRDVNFYKNSIYCHLETKFQKKD